MSSERPSRGPADPDGPTPAQLAVLIARLTGVVDEMGLVLRRSASSPNIRERADSSAALFSPGGELVAQAAHIPVHLGAMPASVAAAIAALGGAVGPGDHVVVNDPYAGGTHLNDVTVVTPVFVGAALVGWVANRAHHADVGGAAPGSMPAGAREIGEEGLRLPPVRLTPEVRALFCANSRTPEERAGDLDAQLGANVVGARRLAELVAGGAHLDAVLAHGERRAAATLADLPRGTWHAADVVDSAGPDPDQRVPATIRLALTNDGEHLVFDFTASDPQTPGNVNAVRAVTASAVAWAVRACADPTLPANGGVDRRVVVRTAAGTVVDARPPAAVGAGNVEVSQRVADVCQLAFARMLPGRIGAANQGTMNNVLIGGRLPDGRDVVSYETFAGGQGARPGRDGMSGVHTVMTNTRNTPIEALERAYPFRVRRLRLRPGTGGTGAARGGDGLERDLEVRVDAVVSLIAERHHSRPWGIDGGGPGAPGEHWLLPGGDEAAAERLPDKVTRRVRAGDVIRVRTPGGGGWGRPAGG
jgi:N-methylhydantoinase B/oxoprolinase/acetone carboxylase alpha subunit